MLGQATVFSCDGKSDFFYCSLLVSQLCELWAAIHGIGWQKVRNSPVVHCFLSQLSANHASGFYFTVCLVQIHLVAIIPVRHQAALICPVMLLMRSTAPRKTWCEIDFPGWPLPSVSSGKVKKAFRRMWCRRIHFLFLRNQSCLEYLLISIFFWCDASNRLVLRSYGFV